MPRNKKLNFAWLMLNGYCNLKCEYCYEAKYGFKKEKMNKETVDASMKFINKNCAEGSEVGLYGGEPLIEFDIIRYLFDNYPIYNYSIFTNTILMTQEKLDYLHSKQDFLIMDISLDGAEETQVKNRGAMYDKDIVRQIFKKFKHTGVRSIVVDPSKCYENCKALVELGARRIDLNYASFTELPGKEYIDTLRDQLKKIENEPSFKDVTISEPHYCVDSNDSLCSIGTNRIAIAPNGDIYPCDVFYFVNVYKIGNVFDGINKIDQEGFLRELEKLKDPNRPCPAHVYCMALDNKKQ
jgi:uncharacterized protein